MENQNQENEIELSTVEVSQFLAAALEYAEKGLSVFPLIPNGKRPITSNGFKDGTTDEQTIRNMWERSPDANVGIVTGGKSGIVVLDVDMKSGKNGFESLESLARETKIDTRATSTPSGGKHYYFRHPGTHISCSAGSLGDGLDVRADGGYIVAPPSVIDGVDYKWDDPGVSMAPCPNWLMSVKQRASASKLDGVVREGERNDHIFRLACSLRGRAIPYDEAEVEILTAASACDPPLPDEEALRCLISAYEYPEGDEFSKEILELNKKHAVVRIGGNCRILSEVFDPVLGLDDIAFSSTASFKELYGNRKVNEKKLAEAWLEHPGRRQYESIVFAPGAETPGYYNLWRGSPCKSQEGDCSLFLSHVKENIANGDEEIYNYIIAWMADVIQRPRDLPGVAIVLRGKQGTGKGVFANQFGKLFGKHYKHLAHEKHLTGNFNNHLKDAIFVFADEAFWGGRKDSEGALKALITEERLTIEGKGQDQYFVKNHIHLMMASNNEWVVPASFEERRFLILDVSERHQQDHAYFSAITTEMDYGGREALLYYLENYDLSGVNLRVVPKTKALFEMKLHSMSAIQKFWYGRLQAGTVRNLDSEWKSEISVSELKDEYKVFLKDLSVNPRFSDEEFGKQLHKLIPNLIKIRPTINNVRVYQYKIPSLKECRDYFQKIMHTEITWESAHDPEETAF